MYQISDKQIDYILNDISARGVEMESLQQNLLDHICCIIENNLEENGDFESFYKKTIKTFYKDALWEIEEETISLLTFKNYYTMKKVMIISGTLSVLGFIAGSFLKIMHWPGASLFLLLASVTISLVFLPLLFVLKTKEVNATRDKLILGLGTLFGILFCLSSLFKVMHWPGANIMWLTALGVLLLLFAPIYFFTGIRNPETKVNTIVTTIIIIAAGGMLFTLTSLKSSNSSRFVQTYNYLQEESFLDMMKQFPKNDSTYHNTELKQLSDTIHASCNKIKAMIIYDGIGRNNIPDDFEARDLCLEDSELGDKFNSGQEGEKLLSDLKNKIKMYNALVIKNFDSQKNTRPMSLPNEINKLLIAHSKHLVVTNFNILFAINKIQTILVGNEIK